MNSDNLLRLDINQLDSYLSELKSKLQQPVNDKMRDFNERRATILSLRDVAALVNESPALEELNSKLEEVEICLETLRNIWNQQGPPAAPPPAVSVESDQLQYVPSSGDNQNQPTTLASDTGGTEAAEDNAEEQAEEQAILAQRSEKSETDRIAEEALRDSRRRGYAGANNVKATPNGIPARNYDVLPASSQAPTNTGLRFGVNNLPGSR